ncbi:MAG: hypothetical protein M3Y08_12410 [Fibrobacterota bacterium]|nr:hypothetical protein [Fibrobacterota bacterium]
MLHALEAFKQGDFNAKLIEDVDGIDGKICFVFNEVLDMNRRLVRELDKVNRGVGKEGKITQRISMGPVEGGWSDAVSSGDLSQTVAVEAEGRPLKGEFLRSAKTVNTMVSRLSSFASEATRVARGRFGRQTRRPESKPLRAANPTARPSGSSIPDQALRRKPL